MMCLVIETPALSWIQDTRCPIYWRGKALITLIGAVKQNKFNYFSK